MRSSTLSLGSLSSGTILPIENHETLVDFVKVITKRSLADGNVSFRGQDVQYVKHDFLRD